MNYIADMQSLIYLLINKTQLIAIKSFKFSVDGTQNYYYTLYFGVTFSWVLA